MSARFTSLLIYEPPIRPFRVAVSSWTDTFPVSARDMDAFFAAIPIAPITATRTLVS
jgi:hypothetical protein